MDFYDILKPIQSADKSAHSKVVDSLRESSELLTE
jgi:hypothetical protein